MIIPSRDVCYTCEYEKHSSGIGLCLIKKGADSLPVMCVGNWATHKHYYLERYLDLVIRAMTKSWGGKLFYIDLFCGPGKCILRETGEEIDGSPLIALRYKFAGYIFVDKADENIKVLKQRCESRSTAGKIHFVQGDCNLLMENIKNLIPERSLSIALVDPFGLDFAFDSYKKLTKNRKVDLIINFPLGMAIKRNLNQSNHQKLDIFLGGTDWEETAIGNPTTHFISYFKENLEKIDYKIPWEDRLSGDVIIKTIKKRVPLYYLLFASKHPLGSTFWKKIRKYDPTGQPSLF